MVHVCNLRSPWVPSKAIRNGYHLTKCLEVRLPDARTQSDRRRLGSVTFPGLGLGLGTSLFPVGATEIKGL